MTVQTAPRATALSSIQAGIQQARREGDLEAWQFPVRIHPPDQQGNIIATFEPFPFKFRKAHLVAFCVCVFNSSSAAGLGSPRPSWSRQMASIMGAQIQVEGSLERWLENVDQENVTDQGV